MGTMWHNFIALPLVAKIVGLIGVAALAGVRPVKPGFGFEWGSSSAGQSLPAARSRFRAVRSDSISTRPSRPVA
jgi:hypothetical protein